MAVKKRTATRLERELRYLAIENVAKDFPDAKSRKAFAALLGWFSLNAAVAWRLKNGSYTTNARAGRRFRDLDKAVAIVLDDKKYERAAKALGVKL